MVLAVYLVNTACLAVPPAFPGAEGAGMYSLGGRGGVVYEVINLNDSGPGSFRAACEASGARTVVFRVSGTIVGLSRISILNPYITIAGQTAPGDGICIRGCELMIRTHNVVLRYMRFRGSAADSLDVMYGANNVVVDHCTVTWGGDECLSAYGNTNVTIQWCMIGEGLYDHSCGGLWGSSSSYHHNLIYSDGTRNPKFAYTAGDAVADFRNNVVYNWGYQSSNAGDTGLVNMVANYYEYGPGTAGGSARYRILGDGGASLYVYATDNYVWGYPAVTADNWAGGIQATCIRSYTPFDAPAVTQQTAEVAREYVVGSAGCSYPGRDSADLRFLNEMETRTYSFAGLKNGVLYPGIPDASTALDWPTLNSLPAPTDSDHDGMPDAWETANGLNPGNAADRNYYTLNASYTNLEVYLNSLCPNPYAPTPNPMTFANAPYAASTTSVAMSASEASDPYGVEYYFTCVSGGGHDSGWQTSRTYVDAGLTPMAMYSYNVRARSTGAGLNTTLPSVTVSASTDAPPDHEAPEPNVMTWAVLPHAMGIDTIAMTATTATDRSGVEYFFGNVTDPNHSSSWQDSPVYTDTGLANNTNYVYKVKARDLSAYLNETQWSADANSATARYVCSESSVADLDDDCEVDFRDLAVLAASWGMIPAEPLNLITNGTFDDNIAGWQFLPPVATDGIVTASFDASDGNPAGSALVNADTTLAATNSSRFYQVIPVEAGREYRLSGEWMGDIKGTVGTVPSTRNWAEIYVTFVTDGSAVPTSWGGIMYKKAFGVANQNIGPTGAWSWEPITASVADGPADGVFTASDDYMVVAVNLGGRINSGQTYVNIDNFEVVQTTACTAVDLNNDCVLDFLDVQEIALNYLSCGRNPVTECWQQ